MAKPWLRLHLSQRRFLGIEFGFLLVALVCVGFTPWRMEQISSEQLNESQKARLVRMLRPIAPTLATVQLWSDELPANVHYRLELAKLFEAVGVRTDAADLHGQYRQGLVVVVQDKGRPPQKAVALVRALRKAGLDPSLAQDASLADRPQDVIVSIARPNRQGGVRSVEAAAVPASTLR